MDPRLGSELETFLMNKGLRRIAERFVQESGLRTIEEFTRLVDEEYLKQSNQNNKLFYTW